MIRTCIQTAPGVPSMRWPSISYDCSPVSMLSFISAQLVYTVHTQPVKKSMVLST